MFAAIFTVMKGVFVSFTHENSIIWAVYNIHSPVYCSHVTRPLSIPKWSPTQPEDN